MPKINIGGKVKHLPHTNKGIERAKSVMSAQGLANMKKPSGTTMDGISKTQPLFGPRKVALINKTEMPPVEKARASAMRRAVRNMK